MLRGDSKTYWIHQPPSGGCVLKHLVALKMHRLTLQPPSGGCVLKRALSGCIRRRIQQPPSGGCVLKQTFALHARSDARETAAFGRLRVETP